MSTPRKPPDEDADPDRIKISASHPALSQSKSGDAKSGPFVCPSCGEVIHRHVNYLGQTAVCPHCHASVRAPGGLTQEQIWVRYAIWWAFLFAFFWCFISFFTDNWLGQLFELVFGPAPVP